ncbi:hypothetical protein M413DRAFT_72257 [Hebeloma cylindrosporum]|uniref:T6SS Phospholipase effector Tle1-like catalytic domain-containing protein n=1 Tax=Hebeloma cylindrosporum TaxID=76867 RepID=A0A0C3CBS3_HEBCY|nr:hypothetical protein M413DRAFT_72257 [Hebeloma cylindrosporum h7]
MPSVLLPKPISPSTSLESTANTLPPDHPFRTLVLCFDGTGDQFDADNSSIVEFFSMLKKDDPGKQLVYYQAGIGTYTTPQIATPLASTISKNLDMAIAWNLDSHIMDKPSGYEFLMQNYQAHDRICIFGFSRGAYTARCLAGMIHKVGLLPTCNHQQVPFAYKMYTTADDDGWKQSNAFKRAFSNSVEIEFLGVWQVFSSAQTAKTTRLTCSFFPHRDTVNSVGLIPRRLPFTTSNTVANLWNRPNPVEQTLSITDKKVQKEAANSKPKKSPTGTHNGKESLKALEAKYSKDKNAATDIDEVWFAGCHCDVGGGSVSTGVQPCLARIPLRWMVRECFRTNSGILFHIDGLKKIGLDPAALYPVVLPRPPALPLDHYSPETSVIQTVPKVAPLPVYDDDDVHVDDVPQESEELLDRKDSLAPIYDQLSLAWFWWILEYIPFRNRFQQSDHTWTTKPTLNRGQGRFIPKQKSRGVRIHRSVKTRLEATHADGSPYKPKVENLDMSRVTWVD